MTTRAVETDAEVDPEGVPEENQARTDTAGIGPGPGIMTRGTMTIITILGGTTIHMM